MRTLDDYKIQRDNIRQDIANNRPLSPEHQNFIKHHGFYENEDICIRPRKELDAYIKEYGISSVFDLPAFAWYGNRYLHEQKPLRAYWIEKTITDPSWPYGLLLTDKEKNNPKSFLYADLALFPLLVEHNYAGVFSYEPLKRYIPTISEPNMGAQSYNRRGTVMSALRKNPAWFVALIADCACDGARSEAMTIFVRELCAGYAPLLDDINVKRSVIQALENIYEQPVTSTTAILADILNSLLPTAHPRCLQLYDFCKQYNISLSFHKNMNFQYENLYKLIKMPCNIHQMIGVIQHIPSEYIHPNFIRFTGIYAGWLDMVDIASEKTRRNNTVFMDGVNEGCIIKELGVQEHELVKTMEPHVETTIFWNPV